MSATWKQPQAAIELIGDSASTRAVRDLIDRVARSDASVLVTGPSGSGKEVVAQLLHRCSPRAARPFIAVNCAAIPRELLESEIFGHEAGSFTGAVRAKRGRFEAADHGTLFLDEIGDMPGDMQVKLLRILETRIVERLGSMIGIPVDVRLVAATNVELETAIADGRFREDLFYRLNVVEIRLTPLAERRQDIPQLLEHFAANGLADRRVEFTAAATDWLSGQPWRGNVRELRNFVDRAAALHGGEIVGDELAQRLMSTDRRQAIPLPGMPQRLPPATAGLPRPAYGGRPLPEHRSAGDQFVERQIAPWLGIPVERQPIDRWLQGAPAAALPAGLHPSRSAGTPIDLKALLDQVEQSYIEQALDCSAGGVAESARMLGLRRTTLIEKMRRLNIQRLAASGMMAGPVAG